MSFSGGDDDCTRGGFDSYVEGSNESPYGDDNVYGYGEKSGGAVTLAGYTLTWLQVFILVVLIVMLVWVVYKYMRNESIFSFGSGSGSGFPLLKSTASTSATL